MQKARFKLIPAVYLILRKDNQVLLLKRVNTGYQDGNYSFIAGHLDGNELATAAMAREAKEEADIIVDPSQLKFVHLSHRLNRNEVNQERLDIFYELNVWQGEINNNEPDKAADLSWFELSDLPSNIIPFIKNVLSDVQSGISYSEYLSEPE